MDTLFSNYGKGAAEEEDEEDYEAPRQYKIDLDELYENKKKSSLVKLSMYNKILQRIHQRIKVTSRQRHNNTICFFVMPEVMIGYPTYDIADCLVYIMSELESNGFKLKYIHPNLLIICWEHWVPSYVRSEVKKKTGVEIDGHGNKVLTKEEKIMASFENKSSKSLSSASGSRGIKASSKQSNAQSKILNLKNSLIYDNDIINTLREKL